jgi:hypothetical protein
MPTGIYQHKKGRHWKLSETTKEKIRMAFTGDKNHQWKGNKVGYRALHHWVKKHLGEAKKCEHCGKIKTTPKSIQWANISHNYLRDLTDWIQLCVKCHKSYDKICSKN